MVLGVLISGESVGDTSAGVGAGIGSYTGATDSGLAIVVASVLGVVGAGVLTSTELLGATTCKSELLLITS